MATLQESIGSQWDRIASRIGGQRGVKVMWCFFDKNKLCQEGGKCSACELYAKVVKPKFEGKK